MSDNGDFEYLIVDSTIIRAHQHASGAERGLTIRRLDAPAGAWAPSSTWPCAGSAIRSPSASPPATEATCPGGPALIAGLPARVVLADGAYDARPFGELISGIGTAAIIPTTLQRASSYPFDRQLYRELHLVECCFSRLKQFRRVATRFKKTALNYLAVVTLAAAIL